MKPLLLSLIAIFIFLSSAPNSADNSSTLTENTAQTSDSDSLAAKTSGDSAKAAAPVKSEEDRPPAMKRSPNKGDSEDFFPPKDWKKWEYEQHKKKRREQPYV